MGEPSVVIGVTGPFGSGCTEVSKHLEAKGFFRYRMSSPISTIATERGISKDSRDDMQTIGDELRQGNGAAHLANIAIKRVEAEQADMVVLDGLRNSAEILALQRRFANFYTIAVQAERDTRYQRVKKKMGLHEDVFNRADARDRDEGEAWGQQVRQCTDMADMVLQNDKNLDLSALGLAEALWARVDRFVALMTGPGREALQDQELHMSLAANASLRSMCIGRQVGAVITSDVGEVLSVGYNEVPRGDRPCITVYGECFRKRERARLTTVCSACKKEFAGAACPECHALIDANDLPSKNLDLCRALHAEESAVLQLAKLAGPSPVGGTIFTTTFPCMLCAKKIVAVGIRKVFYIDPYPVEQARMVLTDGGVEVVPFEGVKAHALHRLFRRASA